MIAGKNITFKTLFDLNKFVFQKLKAFANLEVLSKLKFLQVSLRFHSKVISQVGFEIFFSTKEFSCFDTGFIF